MSGQNGGLDLAGRRGRRNRRIRDNTANYRTANAKRRIDVSQKRHEAVVKIRKDYAKTARSARNMVDYISRDGDLALATETGALIQSSEDRADLIDTWLGDLPSRKNGRMAAHMIVSAPKGASARNAAAAAAEWGQVNLSEDYHYVQVTHTDEEHPHTHFIVARKEDGPALRFSREDIAAFRDSWAEIGTKHNIPMVASRRLERGETRRSLKQSDIHIRNRDGFTRSDLLAAAEVLGEATREAANPWDEALQERLAAERAEYEKLAALLDKLAETNGGDRPEVFTAAKHVKRQAMALRQVKTRRDIMRNIVESKEYRGITVDSSPQDLAKAYAMGDDYIRRVTQPARDDVVRREVNRARRVAVVNELDRTRQGREFLQETQRDQGRERD